MEENNCCFWLLIVKHKTERRNCFCTQTFRSLKKKYFVAALMSRSCIMSYTTSLKKHHPLWYKVRSVLSLGELCKRISVEYTAKTVGQNWFRDLDAYKPVFWSCCVFLFPNLRLERRAKKSSLCYLFLSILQRSVSFSHRHSCTLFTTYHWYNQVKNNAMGRHVAWKVDEKCVKYWVRKPKETICETRRRWMMIILKQNLNTRWFKYDRDWFVCKQAALRSSCATLREWSHNLHPPSCSG